jgi:hypothetical protein
MPKLPHAKIKKFRPTKQQEKQMDAMFDVYMAKPMAVAVEALVLKIFERNDEIEQYKKLWREALNQKETTDGH